MRTLMWSALAAGFLLVGGSAAWASDTVRLGGPAAQTDIQGGTDTELVHWGRGGGFGRGGFGGGYGRGGFGGGFYGRGGYGGFYGRGYYGGFYGGGRGFGGFYAGGYGRYNGWPRFYSSYYSQPYYYSSYYSQPYYYTPTYYQPCDYYYPIAGESAPTMTLQAKSTYQTPAPQGDGTFSYDGGPRRVVPMPDGRGDVNPAKDPRGVVPLDGRLVVLPSETRGGVSPVTSPEIQRLRYVSTPSRVSYPAYGEEAIPPVTRVKR